MFSPRPVGGRLLEDGDWDINVQLVTTKYNSQKGAGADEWGDQITQHQSSDRQSPIAPIAEGDDDE